MAEIFQFDKYAEMIPEDDDMTISEYMERHPELTVDVLLDRTKELLLRMQLISLQTGFGKMDIFTWLCHAVGMPEISIS